MGGLPPMKLHGLRHTWATLALAAGIHPKVVQEALGHASITMTLDTYSAVLPGLHDAATATVAAHVFADDADGHHTGTRTPLDASAQVTPRSIAAGQGDATRAATDS